MTQQELHLLQSVIISGPNFASSLVSRRKVHGMPWYDYSSLCVTWCDGFHHFLLPRPLEQSLASGISCAQQREIVQIDFVLFILQTLKNIMWLWCANTWRLCYLFVARWSLRFYWPVLFSSLGYAACLSQSQEHIAYDSLLSLADGWRRFSKADPQWSGTKCPISHKNKVDGFGARVFDIGVSLQKCGLL